MLIEAFVAQPTVQRFDERVLVRLVRFNQPQLHAALVRPSDHRLAAELLAVIAADHLGPPAAERQAIHQGGDDAN